MHCRLQSTIGFACEVRIQISSARFLIPRRFISRRDSAVLFGTGGIPQPCRRIAVRCWRGDAGNPRQAGNPSIRAVMD